MTKCHYEASPEDTLTLWGPVSGPITCFCNCGFSQQVIAMPSHADVVPKVQKALFLKVFVQLLTESQRFGWYIYIRLSLKYQGWWYKMLCPYCSCFKLLLMQTELFLLLLYIKSFLPYRLTCTTRYGCILHNLVSKTDLNIAEKNSRSKDNQGEL